MKTVRISGLIRAVDLVRRQLAGAPSPEQRGRAMALVSSTLLEVDGILASHRATAKNLPAPSQRAYRFLQDLRRNPAISLGAETSAPSASITNFQWPGLRSTLERNLHRLATANTRDEIARTQSSIAAASGQIEGDVQRRNIQVHAISPESRDIRGWLALLANNENIHAYIAARKLANSLLDAPAQQSGRWRTPFLIHFRPMRGIYRIRNARDGSIAAMPTPMMAFDRAAFEAMSDLMFRGSAQARRTLHEQMLAEPFQNIQAQLASLSGVVEQAAGAFHDLNASFDRVNQSYFANQMPKPHLTWSRIMTGRKFGHHDAVRDTVLLSSTLDRADVPDWVVDFVMYHELLHKQLGLRWIAGRRYAHTTEFSVAEQQFKQFAKAQAWLARLASER